MAKQTLKGIRSPEQTVSDLISGYGKGTDSLFSLLWDVVDAEIVETISVLNDVGVPEHTIEAVTVRMRDWATTHFNPESY